MRDKPLIVSLLVGLIVVLVIGGVSLLVKMNSVSGEYKKKVAQTISFQKAIEELKEENTSLNDKNDQLNKEIEGLNSNITELKTEIMKMEELKNKLEEALKDELIEKKLQEN